MVLVVFAFPAVLDGERASEERPEKAEAEPCFYDGYPEDVHGALRTVARSLPIRKPCWLR